MILDPCKTPLNFLLWPLLNLIKTSPVSRAANVPQHVGKNSWALPTLLWHIISMWLFPVPLYTVGRRLPALNALRDVCLTRVLTHVAWAGGVGNNTGLLGAVCFEFAPPIALSTIPEIDRFIRNTSNFL